MIISRANLIFRVLSSRSRLPWLKYFLSCEVWSLLTWKSECLQYRTLMSMSYMTFWFKVTDFLQSHNYYMAWHFPVQCLPTPSSLVRGDLYCLRCLVIRFTCRMLQNIQWTGFLCWIWCFSNIWRTLCYAYVFACTGTVCLHRPTVHRDTFILKCHLLLNTIHRICHFYCGSSRMIISSTLTIC